MAELPSIESWKEGTSEDITLIENCLCPNCESTNASTTMLPTKVPMFREIIIMTLQCPDCYFSNTEVTFGGEIQQKGIEYKLEARSQLDLNRQVVKSDSCTLVIPELEFEIPASTQRGTVSTLEGILSKASTALDAGQRQRLELGDIENFTKCHQVIEALRSYLEIEETSEESSTKFTVILNDPAGNSFIESISNSDSAVLGDAQLIKSYYERTPTQDMQLGLQPSQSAKEDGAISDTNPLHKNKINASSLNTIVETSPPQGKNIAREEVMKFQTTCPSCYNTCETDMCVTDIPHFKEVIIMSLVCDHCGYKSNEVKGGGAIPKFGTSITLSIKCKDDLEREVLKSDTAGIAIPELELELQEGGLEGVYTSIEGLLQKLQKRLIHGNPFDTGDSATKHHTQNEQEFSAPSPQVVKYRNLLQTLEEMSNGTYFPFTLVITDPLSNSFVGPIPKDAIQLALQAEQEGTKDCYEAYIDENITITEFERSFQQNEDLGLNDIKTENYSASQDQNQYYATDQFSDLPDRLQIASKYERGADHPLQVGKANVEGDTTVMGPGSANFAVPGLYSRGAKKE